MYQDLTPETPAQKVASLELDEMLATAVRYSQEKVAAREAGNMEECVACSEAEKLALKTAYDICVEHKLTFAWCPMHLLTEFGYYKGKTDIYGKTQ